MLSRLSTVRDGRMSHRIILLEQPQNNHFVNIAREGNADISIMPGEAELNKALMMCDMVVIHWWHHPKTAKFLYELPAIPVRLIFWTHISCLTVPALPREFLTEAARVIFTTEGSYDSEGFCSIDNELLFKKTGIVPGCSGFDSSTEPSHETHDVFNVGYLGYIDFSKLHPDFILFCKAVNISGARFILAGDAPAKAVLDRQAKEQRLANPFIYLGYMTDRKEFFKNIDVFGYPLMPTHTGTTENSILEAMAFEVPPVLLNQLAEKYIVEDGKTGILVSNAKEYGNAIRYLHENPARRLEMGKNAREYVINKYNLKNFLGAFYQNCEAAMEEPEKEINFKNIVGNTPAQWFTSCLGNHKQAFQASLNAGVDNQTEKMKIDILNCSPLLKGKNKASVLHYSKEFPQDPALKIWAEMIQEEQLANGI